MSAGLISAIKQGDEMRVAEFLAADPDSTSELELGMTALHVAAQYGRGTIVAQLLAHSPQLVERRDRFGMTALRHAIDGGYEQIVQQLLAKNATFGSEDLLTAMRVNNVEIVRELLARSPDLLDFVDPSSDDTLLHDAASYGQMEVVMQLLTHKPSLVDATNKSSELALFQAARRGHEEIAELLLDQKPSQVFHVDKFGNCLLHHVLWRSGGSERFTRKVWEMNKEALHTLNREHKAPYHRMMNIFGNMDAFEWLKWKLSVDEILDGFSTTNPFSPQVFFSEPTIGCIIEQCQSPLQLSLLQDVIHIVYSYIGVHPKQISGLYEEEEGG